MAQKIQGSQRDFSFGEVDVALKRADDHPARKAGLRQMVNARILNSGALQDRPGRRALYPVVSNGLRTERIVMSAGNVFDIHFAAGFLCIVNSVGTTLFQRTTDANGTALPWSASNINLVNYAVFGLTITICFGHSFRPQVVTWDGVSTWSVANYTELNIGFQKRTPFYRIAPQGITLQPAATVGSVNIVASQNYFTAAMIGTRIRFVGRQILITGVSTPLLAIGTVQEPLPGSQQIAFGTNPGLIFSLGDEVIGTVSGSKGIVTAVGSTFIQVQLLTQNSSSVVSGSSTAVPGTGVATTSTYAFIPSDAIVGPSGALSTNSTSVIGSPFPCAVWDEEVINNFRGYPASVFTDQFRLGFCDFASVPGGIAWSSINAPTDLYVGANPTDGMFEIAPGKVQVYYVVPGPESSEFIFCDRKIYYIPISPTNPLKPGSVQFQILSGDGSAQVQPRLAQEAILYANAGQNSVMAIIATGAYLRPFNTKNLCEFHAHLFTSILCIAAPSADGTFNERYAYVLNADGTVVVGKYNADSLATNAPVVGWGPWSGTGVVSWIGAYAADVIFTAKYFGAGVVEILDDAQFLDGQISVNSAPAAFAPPGGKGPLWFIPSQSVTLIDQGSRYMGTYLIDANGFIVPQFNAGENLAAPSLVAGQPWTTTIEPFCPDAQPGADAGQRMHLRQVSQFIAYVIHSSGFLLGHLFSARQTRTSPALGTLMNSRRFEAWNQDDDPTLPPPSRETAETYPTQGSTFDPRVVLIKDTPGPLQLLEIGIEVSI